jgi:hypothetical protein
VERSFFTAAASLSSARPAARCSGLINSGGMGSVEFGVRCGSHVAAGRSYHGIVASPCIAGIVNGASLAIFGIDGSVVVVVVASPFVATLLPLLAIASRNFAIVAGAKCSFSCHMSTRV